MHAFKIRETTFAVRGDSFTAFRIITKLSYIRHNYNGTVDGLLTACETIAQLSDSDFQLFAKINKEKEQ